MVSFFFVHTKKKLGAKFPLDAYETIQMLLTHDNLLQYYNDLCLGLPDVKYSLLGDDVFDHTMSLEFDGISG